MSGFSRSFYFFPLLWVSLMDLGSGMRFDLDGAQGLDGWGLVSRIWDLGFQRVGVGLG